MNLLILFSFRPNFSATSQVSLQASFLQDMPDTGLLHYNSISYRAFLIFCLRWNISQSRIRLLPDALNYNSISYIIFFTNYFKFAKYVTVFLRRKGHE